MVASTVVGVLTFFLPLSVLTVSVAWTVIESEPLVFGFPESTPTADNFNPFGNSTLVHLTVVANPKALVPVPAHWSTTGP